MFFYIWHAVCWIESERRVNFLKRVLLASHGELCNGMFDSVKMIIGEQALEHVSTFSLKPGESALDFANDLKKEIEQSPSDNFIIIADVLGGSVHTALTQVLTLSNVILFSGMNMGLVLDVLLNEEEVDDMWAEKLSIAAGKGITHLSKQTMKLCAEEEF